MVKHVCFITIGEAPRMDLQATYDRYFKCKMNVTQQGLLDGLTSKEAKERFGKSTDSIGILTSRFISGTSIVMDKEKVEIVLQEKIKELEKNRTDIIVILCTGSFDCLTTDKAQLIEAEKVTIPYVKEQYPGQKIGVIVPLEKQKEESAFKWQIGKQGHFAAASPYLFEEENFIKVSQELADSDVIVMDCVGYSDKMKQLVSSKLPGIEVIQSNEVLFQYVLDLIE